MGDAGSILCEANDEEQELMDFSVLISVYRKERPESFRQALESVFSQTLRAAQVVLVKDGILTPELETVVEDFLQFPELEVVTLLQHGGLGNALNEGLKHCRYSLVARMDADDISKPDRFEKQVGFLKRHPEIVLVGSWVEEFEGDKTNVISIRKVPETSEEIYKYCKNRCPVNHPTVMFRKEAVMAVGGYLTMYFPEDYFLWVKMLNNGSKFYNLQESLLYFRYSPETIKKRSGWKYAIGEIHIQKMIFDLGFISFPLFIKNSMIRFVARIIPLTLRMWVYARLLRSRH